MRIRPLLVLLGAAGLSLHTQPAAACGCAGVGSPSAAITEEGQSWGARGRASADLAHGVWDASGVYSELGVGEVDRRESIELALAWRMKPQLELSVGTFLVATSVSALGRHDQSSGFGDTSLRVRYDLAREAMPYESGPWPSLSLLASVTLPTGELEADNAASTGLGTWQASIGFELMRSLPHAWQVELLLLLAERSPDTTLGVERQLGPQALGQLGLSQAPVPELRLGVFSTLLWAGEVSYAGETAVGSAQRLWTVSAFVMHELPSTDLRASLSVEYAPPLDDISVNAVGYTGLRAALNWAK